MKLSIGLGMITVTALVVTCVEERRIGPQDHGWVVYAGARLTEDGTKISRVYLLDADSLHVTDSLLVFPQSGALSPDGRYLYATIPNYLQRVYSTCKIDVSTKDTLWSSSEAQNRAYILRLQASGSVLYEQNGAPDCGTLAVSPANGGVIAQRDGLCILGQATQGSPLLPIIAVEGDQAQPTLDTTVHLIDARTGETKWTTVLRLPDGGALAVLKVVLHQDGERLLALGYSCEGAPPCEIAFVVCDVHTGLPELVWPMTTPTGSIAISHSGRYVMVSDAKNAFRESPEYIDLIDLDTGAHLQRFFPTSGFDPDLYRIGEMEFLPDDRRVVIATADVGIGPLRVIDTKSMTVAEPIWLPHSSPDGNWHEGGILLVGRRP